MKKLKRVAMALLSASSILLSWTTFANQVSAVITISSSGSVSVSPDLEASPAEFLDTIDKDGGFINVTVENNSSSAFSYTWTGYGVTSSGSVVSGIVSQDYSNTISANSSSYHIFNVAANTSSASRMVYLSLKNLSKNFDVLIGGSQLGLTYTVTYKPGANGSGSAVTSTKYYGSALTLKGAIFTRTGYVQTGWATSDGGSKVYDLAGSYTLNKAVTLYPVWTLHVATNYALLVGINNYSLSGASTLKGCVADVLSMEMVCTDYGDWEADNILVLTNNLESIWECDRNLGTISASCRRLMRLELRMAGCEHANNRPLWAFEGPGAVFTCSQPCAARFGSARCEQAA